MKFLVKKSRGFGLIETLVACAILILICGSLLAINVLVTRDIVFARGRSVAFNLAQEGIESVRQIRDTNLVDRQDTTNWNTFVCSATGLSPLDYTSVYKVTQGRLNACYPGNTISRIALTSDSAGEPIIIGSVTYTRKISFMVPAIDPAISNATITSANAVRVKVQVDWTENGSGHTIQTTELLTNWKRGL